MTTNTATATAVWQYRVERCDSDGNWVLMTASAAPLPAETAQDAALQLRDRLAATPRMLANPLRVLVWPGSQKAEGPAQGTAEVPTA